MKTQFRFLLRFYLTVLATFVLAKLIFFAYNGFPTLTDLVAVLWHGLALDLNVASYLSAPLWLALLLSPYLPQAKLLPSARIAYRCYAAIITLPIVITLLVDVILYKNWGFKLDAIVLSYLDNPSAVFESLSLWLILLIAVAFALLLTGYVRMLWAAIPSKTTTPPTELPNPTIGKARMRSFQTMLWIALGGLMFLTIRGGVGKSTANIGLVYYSSNQYLNHAAVNPTFSFFYSLLKQKHYGANAQFFAPAEAQRLFQQMAYNTESRLLPADSLLRTTRPNILLVIMESCGGRVVGCTEGSRNVTPTLDSLAHTGVFFTRCYSNSFRTDRGTICTLSGYPAFPDASLMKLPAKNRLLPSIANELRKVGYDTEFYYGGDKNFTNMNAYFLATGYNRVYGDTDFPADMRKTNNWGVTDHLMFQILRDSIERHPRAQLRKPWFKTLMTLSSHEPWEVPYRKFDDPKLNAFAYLDNSIKHFIENFRKSPEWDNTLIIFLPDHGVGWPADINEFDTRKFHSPLIWTGGALRGSRRIERICNQTDLAATLLGQLGIDHSRFYFSRDVLSQTYRYPCALHAWPEGFTLIDSTGHSTYELATQKLSATSPDPSGQRLKRAKAFMQTAYRHLNALK